MSINTNVGMVSGSAGGEVGKVAVQGSSTNMATPTDTGSILAVKYIKNDTSEVTSPSNVGTIALKNWFAEFVGTLGNFDKSSLFHAAILSELTSTTLKIISLHLSAKTDIVGPPTYPAPIQQTFLTICFNINN